MYMGLLMIAVLGYAVQNTLVGGLVRRHDLGVVITWRGLSLLVTMAPLLLLADRTRFADLGGAAIPLALACLLASAANVSAALVVQRLPIGIANALTQGLSALFLLLLAMPLLGEHLRGAEYLWIGAVLSAVIFLGIASSRGARPVTRANLLIGLGASGVFGICMAGALIALKRSTMATDPLIAAWIWEGGIGLCCLAALLVRRLVKHTAPLAASPQVLLRITLYSLPTLVGTGCYTSATAHGSVGIAGAMLSTIMVVAAVCAWLFWRERLTWVQWLAILTACGAVAGLGLAGA